MKKFSLKKWSLTAAFVILFACGALLAKMIPAQVKADVLQSNSDAVQIDYGYHLPEELGLSEERAGTRLRASESGASVSFSDTFSGTFVLDFRVISQNAYSGSMDAALGSVYTNNELELSQMSLSFTEPESGDSFSVIFQAGAAYDVVTPTARVAVGDAVCGLHYNNGELEAANTTIQNSLGYYTRLNGTSFCNVALTNNALTSEGVKPVVFTFEPSTMCVYGIYYGQSTSMVEKRLILDLRDASLIGEQNVLEPFSEYNVSLQFDEIITGKEATIVLYELNGCSLSENTVSGGLPVVYPALETEGLVGEWYAFPEPVLCSVGGTSDADVTIEITDPAGQNVGLAAKEPGAETDGVYHEGCGFTPMAEGIYKLTYRVKDEEGNSGIAAEAELNVIKELPNPEYFLSGEYPENRSVGAGYELTVFSAEYYMPWYIRGKRGTATVSLLKNGVPVGGYEDIAANEDYVVKLEDAGVYEIVYSAGEAFAEMRIAYTVVSGQCNFYDEGVKSAYSLGERFSLPVVEAQLGDTVKTAEVVLLKPDGELCIDRYPLLDQRGTYRFVYAAEFDGVLYQKTREFQVTEGEVSLFESVKDSTFETGVSLNHSLTPIQGLKVTGNSDGASIRYNKTIDLSQKTRAESLIELAVIPSEYGTEDFNQLTILLTDIYDSTNYVQITVYKGSWGNSISFVKAGAKGQIVAGLESGALATRFDLGTSTMMSFAGNRVIGSETLKIYYDNNEKAVYADALRRPTSDGMINDFDSAELQGETSVWSGFTTGEVTMTITMTSFNRGSGSYLITSIDGQPLGNECVRDETPPEIYIDRQGYGEPPSGGVGRQYRIFAARAFDRGEGTATNVEASVWLYYGTASAVEYPLSGRVFVPDRPGVYTILFTSSDATGNVSTISYNVSVAEKLPAISLTGLDDVQDAYFVGATLVPPQLKADGGSGEKTIELALLKDDRVQPLENTYLFESDGLYILRVTVTDYLGFMQIFEKELHVTVSDKPIVQFPTMPTAFINGSTYELPEFEAIDYTSGVPIPANIQISVFTDADDRPIVLEGNTFTPQFGAEVSMVTVRITAKTAQGEEVSKDYEIPLLHVKDDEGGLQMEKLFLTDGVVAVSSRLYTEFVAERSDAWFMLANPVIADGLNLEFGGDGAKINFSALTVTLADADDPSIAVSFVLTVGTDAQSVFTASGQQVAQVSGSFSENNHFRFTYSALTHSLQDQNALVRAAQIRNCDNGQTFNGFPSGKVTVGFTFGGVAGDSSVRLVQIGNQMITNRNIDAIAPQITYDGEVPLSGIKGAEIALPAAIIADVIDPNASVRLTVYGPENDIVLETNEIVEGGVKFIPEENGKYRVVYTISDASGNSFPQTYNLNVADVVAPELVVNGEISQTASVGDTIRLPGASATDDTTEALKIEIFVIDPHGVMYTADETLKVTEKGRYIVRYYVRDDNYNFAMREFVITVA